MRKLAELCTTPDDGMVLRPRSDPLEYLVGRHATRPMPYLLHLAPNLLWRHLILSPML